MSIPTHQLSDFDYDLPANRIAEYPLSQRDHSKLLICDNGEIKHSRFKELNSFLPEKSRLIFNNTRVISARLNVFKETGANIEIFLLEPHNKSIEEAMSAQKKVEWKCMIGNLKRWNDGLVLTFPLNKSKISMSLNDRAGQVVKFTWETEEPFSKILDNFGKTPLPPYIKREAGPGDKHRYQTIYSLPEGAVAAPTAGLHFTEHLLDELKRAGHQTEFLTLHVGAGTFSPVKVENVALHKMHTEKMVVERTFIENLLSGIRQPRIAVGTTSVRTLESLYWYGVMLEEDQTADFSISSSLPYESNIGLPVEKALRNILKKLNNEKRDTLKGETGIFIVPGYTFKIIDGLITNFHMPKSTLIMLIAAFSGNKWKNMYREALENDYRFLSYGDSMFIY